MEFGKIIVQKAKRDSEFGRKVLGELEKRLKEHTKQIKVLTRAKLALEKIVEKQK